VPPGWNMLGSLGIIAGLLIVVWIDDSQNVIFNKFRDTAIDNINETMKAEKGQDKNNLFVMSNDGDDDNL